MKKQGCRFFLRNNLGKVLDKEWQDSIIGVFDEAARKVAKTLIFEN
jgi:hypothetical protein